MENNLPHTDTFDDTAATGPTDGDVVVDIKNLKKSFGHHHILKGINLQLKRGENLVVLGKSGTGKSVLIKCLVRLIEPDEGSIQVLGSDMLEVGHKQLNELRRKIGFLFQGAALYDSMTVRENLEFPLRRNKNLKRKEVNFTKLIEEALDNVGLLNAIDKMPSELSGGMRKRIGLARTIILKPDIMLYDEPTTGLDTATSKEISNLILSVQKKYNTSSIIITHDMECARMVANRVIIFKEGLVTAIGTYEELKNSDDEFVSSFFI